MMPHSIQVRRLKQLAEQIQHTFSFPDLAETSFISTARFRDFDPTVIEEVAVYYWPDGQTAHRRAGQNHPTDTTEETRWKISLQGGT